MKSSGSSDKKGSFLLPLDSSSKQKIVKTKFLYYRIVSKDGINEK